MNFESPQFKPIDHLKGVNGELILETDAIDYGDKISFYIEKSKLRMKSTFPKIMILSSFYEYDIPANDLYADHVPKNKESKVSIVVSEVHLKKNINVKYMFSIYITTYCCFDLKIYRNEIMS